MTNKHLFFVVTCSILALVTLVAYSYFSLVNGSGEAFAKQALVITFAAFLAILGYEDWKDAKRAGRDKTD